ncbi:MAG: pyruvate ferredoxin oxidoreductase [Bacteroidetes bacterium]|nr:pyruvate ferredoxin oxidoreductase [Bacteroidota bacterium]MCL5024874.1 pyruvate ferredoxin oxidoreductase [Chloroflexota bacterium]
MSERKFLHANAAIAYGVRLARASVVAAYPITPQTSIVEKIASFLAEGAMDAEYIKVESEHSALAACLGACAVGSRAFTATSSQGLEFMHEMLAYVSGGRYPLVLAAVNRSVALPWSIWGDQQDSIQQRDTGWIQLYLETAQEALDTTLQAYRLAEDDRVLTPVMICVDGFLLSHTEEVVEVPDQAAVDAFLPPLDLPFKLDVERPATQGMGAFGQQYARWRAEQQRAMQSARAVIGEADAAFAAAFGRSYGGLIEPYRMEGAEVALLAMGGVIGTARDVVDEMRAAGRAVGLVKVRAYRPFPHEEVRAALRGLRAVAVVDRDCSFGYEGALCTDVKAALYGLPHPPAVRGFIAGLGGSDMPPEMLQEMIDRAAAGEASEAEGEFVGI